MKGALKQQQVFFVVGTPRPVKNSKNWWLFSEFSREKHGEFSPELFPGKKWFFRNGKTRSLDKMSDSKDGGIFSKKR